MKKCYKFKFLLPALAIFIYCGKISAQAILLGNVPANMCANEKLNIPFTTTGTFNAGNTFSVQLSDATGIFAVTPVQVGSITSTASSDKVPIALDPALAFGTNYQIRIVSSSPVVTSNLSLAINVNCITRDYTWINGPGDWSDLSHWMVSSDGGSTSALATEPPTTNDDVFFDSNSFPTGGTLNVNQDAFCNSMIWFDGSTGPQLFCPSNFTFNLRGDLVMAPGVYRDVYFLNFTSDKSANTLDLADNTIKLNSTVFWDGIFTFGGQGSWDMADSLHAQSITINGNATLNTNDNLIDLEGDMYVNGGGTFNAGTSTIYMAGFSQNGAFNAGNSTFMFNKGFGNLSGTAIFHDVTFEDGDFTINGSNSYDNLTVQPGVKLKLKPGFTQLIVFSFSAIGSRSKLIDIQSTTPGMRSGIDLGTSTALVNFVILQDDSVSAATVPVTASNSIDNGNNFNWNIATIAPLDYYWIGGSGNWSDVNHWATLDGGNVLRTDPPGPVDNVNFTTNSFPSGGKVTIDVDADCNDLIMTDGSTNPSIGTINNHSLTVRGNFQLAPGVTRSINDLRFESAGSNVLTFADNQTYTTGNITFDGSGSWSLQDSVSANQITVNNGTFNTNDFTLFLNYSLNAFGGSTNLGFSYVETSFLQGNQAALNAGSSQIFFEDGGIYGPFVLNDVEFDGNNVVYGSNAFNNIIMDFGSDTQLESGQTQSFNTSLTLDGYREAMITLRSTQPGNQAFFSATFGATVTADFVDLRDNNAVGTSFTAFNSIDNGNNPGWTINLITPLTYYWVGGPGNWSDVLNHWSSIDGGFPDMIDPPGQLDDIIFSGNSFFNLGDTVYMDIPVSIHSMTWQDGSLNPVLYEGVDFNELTLSGSLFLVTGVTKSINDIFFNSQANNNLIQLAGNLGGTSNFWFEGPGTWTLLDSMAANVVYLKDGTLKTNGQYLNTSTFYFYFPDTGSETPVLDLGASFMDVFNLQDFTGATGQIVPGTSTINIEEDGLINTDGLVYNNVSFKGNGFVNGSNIYQGFFASVPGSTITLQAGTTSTVNTQLSLDGAPGDPVIINSDTPGSEAFFSSTGKNYTANDIFLYDNHAIGGSTFNAVNSSQFSNVVGWTGALQGQTITFTTSDVPFVNGAVTLNGTSDSGLPVQYMLVQGDATLAGGTVSPNSPGLVEILASQPGDVTYGEALDVDRFIFFTSTNNSNELGNMKEATYVVGQKDFESNDFFFDVNKTPFARKAFVTSDGKLITTGSRRALIWNQVPGQADVPADVVLGQPDFITANVSLDASTIFGSSYAVEVAADGRLLIADNRGILIWNTFPTVSGTPADVIIGQADFTSLETGPDVNRFSGPGFFTISPDQKLIVSDILGNRVLIFNQIPTVNGASADVVLGQPDFFSSDPDVGPDKMDFPSYPAVATDGKLYIPDANNHRVLVFNSIPTVSGTPADAVLGQVDLNSNVEGLGPTSFNRPYSVAFSRTGKMAIADRSNQRVLIYNSIPVDNTVSPDIVLGQPDFTTNGQNTGGVSGRGLNDAYSVYWDPAENLYVGDLLNNRFLVWGLPDFDPPVVTDFSFPQPYVSGSNAKATVTFDERSGLRQADVFYRFISTIDQSYQTAPMLQESDSVWSFDLSVIDSQNAKLGMEFYIDVTDGYGNRTETSANTQITNIAFTAGLPITNFGRGSATENYRLFAVPLVLQNKNAVTVFDEIVGTTYDNTKMRLFSYPGGTATAFNEYNSGFSNINIGKGYFGLVATDANATVLSGPGATVTNLNFNLVNGWNLIGNPYPFTINWSDVETASGFSSTEVQPPQGYNGTYTNQTSIASGEGVFVLNTTGGDLNIVFPVTNKSGSRLTEDKPLVNDLGNDSWEVRFMTQIDGQDVVLGAVGMEPDALVSRDRYDRAIPPSIGEGKAIIFQHSEFFVPSFNKDIKPTRSGENWAFEYHGNPEGGNRQEIHWDNSYYGVSGPDLYLVDKTHFKVVNMKEESQYTFEHHGLTNFEIYFGDQVQEALLPAQIIVDTPYPNPFDQKMNLNIGLPRASHSYKVQIAIYNTMGRLVDVIADTILEPGYHSFAWNGTNDRNESVAQGIYAYKIVVKNLDRKVITGKIIKQ